MSAILTKQLAEAVIPYVADIHERLWKTKLLKRDDLHMIIMDPAKPFGTQECDFEDAILVEHSFSPPRAWEHPYRDIARAKAKATWRTGVPTRIIRECMPHLLAQGDTRYGGSVNLDGLIVAASGVQPWYDEAMSGIAANLLKAAVIEHMQTVIMPGDKDFV